MKGDIGMIEIHVNGRIYPITGNPFYKGTFNITNRMLFLRYLPEEAERLRKEAIKLNQIYDAEQKRRQEEYEGKLGVPSPKRKRRPKS